MSDIQAGGSNHHRIDQLHQSPEQLKESAAKEKASEISIGYSQENSVSRQTEENKSLLLGPGQSQPSIIPEPLPLAGTASFHQVHLSLMDFNKAQDQVAEKNIDGQLDELLMMMNSVGSQLLQPLDLSPEASEEIIEGISSIKNEASKDIIDPSKLEEILMQIQDKLGDQVVKYSSEVIKIRGEERQRFHEQKVDDIKDKIESETKKDYSGPFGPLVKFFEEDIPNFFEKTLPSFFQTDLPVWFQNTVVNFFQQDVPQWFEETFTLSEKPEEANTARQITKEQKSEAIQDSNNKQDLTKTDAHIAAAGIKIATDSISHAEFMKMLMNIEQSEETKEKLNEALLALQSGDLKGLTSLIKDSSLIPKETIPAFEALLAGEPKDISELIKSQFSDIFADIAKGADDQHDTMNQRKSYS